MQNFRSYLPTRVIFGNNQFKTLGDEVQSLGKRALIVTYPIRSLGNIVQEAVDLLKKNGIDPVIFAEVESNPSYALVNRGGKLARE